MKHGWLRELEIEWFWLKKDLLRRWRLDSPVGVMGIIAIISGFALFIVMGQGIAEVIRGAIPWVAGSRVSATYWTSIGYAFKASLIFLVFCGSLIVFFLLKLFYRR